MPSDRGDDVEMPCRRGKSEAGNCAGRAEMRLAQGRRTAIRNAMMNVVL